MSQGSVAGRSSNGRTVPFGGTCLGSNPSRPARFFGNRSPRASQSQPAWRETEMTEAGSVIVADDKQESGANQPANPDKDGKQRDGQNPEPAGKGKDAKPAQERKRARNLSEDKRFKLFSGTANVDLARKIARHIGVTLGDAKLQRFADGEVYFQLLENVRGVDVFVVQPTCYPVDQHLVELLVM